MPPALDITRESQRHRVAANRGPATDGWRLQFATLALFLAPAILVYAGFTAYPVVRTVYNSAHLVGAIGMAEFVGTRNFSNALLADPVFWTAVRNTAIFTVAGTTIVAVPLVWRIRRNGLPLGARALLLRLGLRCSQPASSGWSSRSSAASTSPAACRCRWNWWGCGRGLGIYAAAFIAEIVRAVIQSVHHGQREAALSLGLRPGQVLTKVVLALGWRSGLVVVRSLSVAFIELWRGMPLLTVLFMPAVTVPLFLPNGVSVDRLVRALVLVEIDRRFERGEKP
jgi:ABC-type amino acid transport system permease subunit